MKKKDGKRLPFSRPQGAIYAYSFENRNNIETHIEGVTKCATADDEILKILVRRFNEELGKGTPPKYALCYFREWIKQYAKDGLLSEEEINILHDADYAVSVTGLEDVHIAELNTTQIRAVQTLMKSNPEVIRLPFVQDALIRFLKIQKYELKDREKIKDLWIDFLHKRVRGEIPHDKDEIDYLVERAEECGHSTPGAHTIISEELGISEYCFKKTTRIKGPRGRPKKISK